MKNLYHVLGCLLLTLPVMATGLVGTPTVTVTGDHAVIHWTTDVATGTKVIVSPSDARIDRPAGKSVSTDHEAVISGLRSGVTYTATYGTAKYWLGTNSFTLGGAVSSPQAPAPATRTASTSGTAVKPAPSVAPKEQIAPPTRKIWGNIASLPDHFQRHGPDFGAKTQDEYAQMEWRFLQRAKTEGLPAKVDEEGVLRIYDAKTGTFASYNRDGTAKTFFKPGSHGYFERQPGRLINLKP